ncbi:endonuclease domain-containing protein [Thiorhodospira sibirica]|uniref:endonuclease domain-containing protein n=1 Tax=Thiorhodospira sibirica TaxID=154347 RepID=UPI00022C1720|nr:DUF559 domain-containing protein [Thiorhodospira sibirica]
MAILAHLEAQQQQRQRQTPRVSVLVGEVTAANAIWADWHQQRALPAVYWSLHHPRSSTSHWLETVFASHAPTQAAWRYVAQLSQQNLPALQAQLGAQSIYQRKLWYEHWINLDDPVLAALLRGLLESAMAHTPPTLLQALGWVHKFQPYGSPEQHLMASLATLIPQTQLPGLLWTDLPADPAVLSRWLEGAARLAEAVPALPLAVTLSATSYTQYMQSIPESRHKALIREGYLPLAPLDAARPDTPPPSVTNILRHYHVAEGVWHQATALHQTLAATPPLDADRARSQAERFLFNLLQSIPEFKDRFVLNARLPIQFGQETMEVDFLADPPGLVLELDGYYHFQDAVCYRRDRRKDLLLQQHGYTVVRYLAEDVVSHLEEILATIRHALVHAPGRPIDR